MGREYVRPHSSFEGNIHPEPLAIHGFKTRHAKWWQPAYRFDDE